MKWLIFFAFALPVTIFNLRRLLYMREDMMAGFLKLSTLKRKLWLIAEIILAFMLLVCDSRLTFISALSANWFLYTAAVYGMYKSGVPWPLFVFHVYIVVLLLVITIF